MDCTCSSGRRLKNHNRHSKADEKVQIVQPTVQAEQPSDNKDKVRECEKKTNSAITSTCTSASTQTQPKKKVTRCVGTSPQMEIKHRDVSPMRKAHLSPMKSVEKDTQNNRVLEKSNSLGENKPQRPLRTTRSLSPRPPVKHQTAITVSDENDIVSVKLSPNDADFEDVFNQRKERLPPFSERASPNLSEIIMFKGSDSHLVYVPTDPWLKMPDNMLKKHGSNNEDPWVWRSTTNIVDEKKNPSRKGVLVRDDKIWKSTNNVMSNERVRNPKQMAYRQTKSFSCKDNEELFGGKQLKLITANMEKAEKKPKLQRSKSPAPPPPPPLADDYDYDIPPPPPVLSPRHSPNHKKFHTIQSGTTVVPIGVLVSPSHVPSNRDQPPIIIKSNTLNLPNANLLQPRHSFSTPSQKDDELQLNIRRLSEQIRYNPAAYLSSPSSDTVSIPAITAVANMKSAATNILVTTTTKTQITGSNSKLNSDPMLETTC